MKLLLVLTCVMIAGNVASGFSYRARRSDDDIDQIVGGTIASHGSHPYMAHLTVYDVKGGASVCGATVLDSTHLLTAAHCIKIDGSPAVMYIEVTMRAYVIAPPEDTAIIRTIDGTENIRVHENWNATGKLENDIAILKLDFPINFEDEACTPNGKCIRIGHVNIQDASKVPAGAYAWATGWGKTEPDQEGISPELREVRLRILTAAQCDETIGYTPRDSQICIAQPEGTCRGDSGGPLMGEKRFKNVQIGITSFGDYRCSKVSVFTRVSHYVKNGWIAKHMKKTTV